MERTLQQTNDFNGKDKSAYTIYVNSPYIG